MKNGLIQQRINKIIEKSMIAEMASHLDYDKMKGLLAKKEIPSIVRVQKKLSSATANLRFHVTATPGLKLRL